MCPDASLRNLPQSMRHAPGRQRPARGATTHGRQYRGELRAETDRFQHGGRCRNDLLVTGSTGTNAADPGSERGHRPARFGTCGCAGRQTGALRATAASSHKTSGPKRPKRGPSKRGGCQPDRRKSGLSVRTLTRLLRVGSRAVRCAPKQPIAKCDFPCSTHASSARAGWDGARRLPLPRAVLLRLPLAGLARIRTSLLGHRDKNPVTWIPPRW